MSDINVGLRLNDGLSGTAKKQASSLGDVGAALDKAGSAADRFGAKMDRAFARANQAQAASAARAGDAMDLAFARANAKEAERVARLPSQSLIGFRSLARGLQGIPLFGRMIGDADKFGGTLKRIFGGGGDSGIMKTIGAYSTKLEGMGLDVGGVAQVGMGAITVGAAAALAGVVALGVGIASLAVKLGGLAVDGVKAFANMAINVGKTREDALTSLKVMLKSAEKAQQVYDSAADFARRTPFETEEVIAGYKQLLAVGFKQAELAKTFTTLGDFAAGTGMADALPRTVTVFGQIRAAGRLLTQDLNQLSSMGLSRVDVFNEIAKSMKLKDADAVRKAMEAGKVTSDVAIEAIMNVMNARYGGMMGEKSATMSGLMSTLKSAPFDLFNAAFGKNGQTTGMDRFYGAIKGSVKGLVDVLDPTSPTGQKLVKALSNLGDTLAPIASSVGTFLVGFVEGISDGLGVKSLKDLDLKSFGRNVGQVATKLVDFATSIGEVVWKIAELAAGIDAALSKLGMGNGRTTTGGSSGSTSAADTWTGLDLNNRIGLDPMKMLMGMGAGAGMPGGFSWFSSLPGLLPSPSTGVSPPPGNGPAGTNQNNTITITMNGLGLDLDQLAAKIRQGVETAMRELVPT